MNKIYYIYIVAFTLLVVILSFFIFKKKIKKLENEYTTAIVLEQSKLGFCEAEKVRLFNTWKAEFYSNNVLLKSNLIIENENYNDTILQEILNGKTRLIFRITDNVSSCYDCKKKILDRLDNLSKVIGFEDIIILGKYTRMRDLILLKEREQFKFNVYNYNQKLNINADRNENFEYLFIIDENFETKYTFIVTKATNEKMEEYFKKIRTILTL